MEAAAAEPRWGLHLRRVVLGLTEEAWGRKGNWRTGTYFLVEGGRRPARLGEAGG